MADKEEAPIAQVATGADGQQSAKPVAEAAEPAVASEAARDDVSKDEDDKKEHKADPKPAGSKPKATPAKPQASENQQPAERTSGRRERKQTSFFQPEKKIETEKLEIKEVSVVFQLWCRAPFYICHISYVAQATVMTLLPCFQTEQACCMHRGKAPSSETFQMVSHIARPPCTSPFVLSPQTCDVLPGTCCEACCMTAVQSHLTVHSIQ